MVWGILKGGGFWERLEVWELRVFFGVLVGFYCEERFNGFFGIIIILILVLD